MNYLENYYNAFDEEGRLHTGRILHERSDDYTVCF